MHITTRKLTAAAVTGAAYAALTHGVGPVRRLCDRESAERGGHF